MSYLDVPFATGNDQRKYSGKRMWSTAPEGNKRTYERSPEGTADLQGASMVTASKGECNAKVQSWQEQLRMWDITCSGSVCHRPLQGLGF